MQINDSGLEDANRVEARMVVEVAILGRQQALDQIGRHLV